ncbi:MAG: S-layer homology domain-containing protein [Firmicutes bacterium]|nr:S-layer homology domain-containing protein [Bacillota bacterium]
MSSYTKAKVELAYALGIISGYEVAKGSEFRRLEHTTRAQAAKMLYLMLQERSKI